MAHPGGAPTKLDDTKIVEAIIYVEGQEVAPQHLTEATLYLQSCEPRIGIMVDDNGNKISEKIAGIPTIEGLCLALNISKDTLYRWAKSNIQFGWIVEKLGLKQADQVIQQGAVGNYAPKIAGMLLSKHGYYEKSQTENTISFDSDKSTENFLEG